MLVRFRAGGTPELSQGCHSEAQWCPRLPRCVCSSIFKRFRSPFWEPFSKMTHCLRHPVSECFFEGVQTRTCNDSGFALQPFLITCSLCFQEQVKSWFWWPLRCKSYDLRLLGTPFSLLFCGLFHVTFLKFFFLVSGRFWVPWGLPFGACGVTWRHFFR